MGAFSPHFLFNDKCKMNQPSIDRLKPAAIHTLSGLPLGMNRIGFQTDDSNSPFDLAQEDNALISPSS